MHNSMTLKQLSDQMGISIVNVQDRLRELNVKKNPPAKPKTFKMCDNPGCFTVIVDSKKHTCSVECTLILKAVHFPPKKRIEAEYNKGKSVDEMAETFGLSYATLLHLMYRYGISRSGFSSPQQAKKPMNATSVGGIREDLGGVYVRSRWEGNVLRYLNLKKVPWEFEPKTFVFEEIKRGTRTYTPDVLIYPKNAKKQTWIEVKGYLRPADKTKIKRFKKYFPDEFEKLQAVTQNKNVAATKFFEKMGVPIYAFYDDLTKQYSNKIKNWEG